jgi:diguanylate cyclase
MFHASRYVPIVYAQFRVLSLIPANAGGGHRFGQIHVFAVGLEKPRPQGLSAQIQNRRKVPGNSGDPTFQCRDFGAFEDAIQLLTHSAGAPGAPGPFASPVDNYLQGLQPGAPVTPEDMQSAAQQMATELLGLPESIKDSQLRKLKQHNPVLHSVVRAALDERLELEYKRWLRYGTPLCLAIIDIDHFKKVNDTHGHLMGDRVIQGLGEILRGAVTGANHSAARYGGEEFALLLPQTSLDKSIELAETVRNRTKSMKIRNRTTQEVLLTVTISGGVTALKPDDDAASLISRADAALYAAKNGGRDRVVTHA